MADNPTIIVGHLDDSTLRDSIDKLVKYVGDKTNDMASNFTQGLDKMKLAMKDFAVTQQVSVNLMQEAWRKMSSAFDAMVAAQSAASSSPSKTKAYPDNTVGALEQEIAALKKERKEMELGTDELRAQNRLLEERQKLLKTETTSTNENLAKAFRKSIGDAVSLPSKSYADAKNKLDRLRQLLDEMNKRPFLFSEREFNRVRNAIDSVETKLERMRKKWGSQGQQPNTLQDVLGMDENSFDAISKKMAALKKLSWADSGEQKRIIDEYQRLRLEQNKLLASNAQMTRSNNYLAQSFGYIRNRIMYALTLGAITNFTKQIYEVRGQYELLERSLGVLVNSFERGSQIFQELNAMAIESPFTLMELAGAAKQLTAYNFEANEVVDTTRRLADISSALGVPMERLVYNLGQIRAQTVLTARDARDFANAGLPIVKSLADHYTELEGKVVSTGDVYDRMSKKMVTYSDVMTVINKVTDEGGKFFEFQAKQAQTLRVQMANLTLAWNNALNEIGKSNQGLISLPVQGLKTLLQNWSDLSRVIKNLVLSFGMLRVVQMIAIRNNWQLASSAGGAAKMMGFLGNSVKSLTASMGALFANPWTWVFVGIMAITDLIGKMRAAHTATIELNDDIRNGATEAAEANYKFLSNKGNIETRKLAQDNKLTAEQGAKAWEAIEQQISTSVTSSEQLLGKLWAISDINERVKTGFDYIEKIKASQAALEDLKDTQIKVSQDRGWFGVLGEGLVKDLKDLHEELNGISGGVGMFDNEGKLKDISGGFTEYRKELEKTAQSINNFIKEHNITDPLQITEIIERVKSIIKQKNPEIKGELEALFDVTLDQRMMYLTNGAIDQNTSLWKMFMDRLKHNASNTFQDITSDIYKETAKLTPKQQEAVDKNLEYFKKTMPFYYDAVKAMVDDASQLRIHIGVAFNVQQLTDFQNEVNKRISAKYGTALADQFNAMLPSQNDNLSSWTKTQQDAIAKLREENKKYDRDNTEWAKRRKAENNTEIEQRKELLDLFNQKYEKDKKGSSGGRKKDPMLDTLKQTIDIVKKLQSEYDTLTKHGMLSSDALSRIQQRYKATMLLLNSDLQKYGLDKLNLDIINGNDPNKTLKYFEKLSKILTDKGLSTLDRQKALEVVIQEFSVKAETYNLDKITKGLNNELGRLKDEYELAVSLDADPELGSMFAEMMGININDLPRTVKEYADLYTKYLNEYLSKTDAGFQLDNLNLTNDSLRALEERVKEGTLTQAAYEAIAKAVQDVRDKRKKDFEETTKEFNALIKKYGEYQAKMEEVRQTADKERLTFVKTYGGEEEIKQAIQLTTEIGAEKDPTKKEQLRQQLIALVNQLAGDDATRLKLKVAIDTQQARGEAGVDFEEFQKSPDWIIATGDLANMTNKAIGGLIDSLEDYKKSAKNLDSKQIKQINNALKSLYKQHRQNNPFGAISDAIDQARENASLYDEKLQEMEDKINDYFSRWEDLTNEEKDALGELIDEYDKLRAKKEEVSKINASAVVSGLNNAISSAKSAASMFGELAEAIGGEKMNDAAKTVKKIVGVLDKAGQGAQIGSAFGGYGAAIGGIVGMIVGFVTEFKDELSGNAGINAEIQYIKEDLIKLNTVYKRLQDEADKSYGWIAISAKKAVIANKELQLEEMKRQLRMEESRKEKDKDYEQIENLKGQIVDLELEIKNASNDIINDLLGISGVGDAMESLMDGFIEALRSGEDAMVVFNESIDDMIVNMVKKMFVTKILQPWFEKQWSKIQNDINSRAAHEQQEYDRIANMTDEELAEKLAVERMRAAGIRTHTDEWENSYDKYLKDVTKEDIENYRKTKKAALDNAIVPTTDDIRKYAELLRTGQPVVEESMKEVQAFLEELGLMKETSTDKSLSALQQGIQGITETTAGALEAYMNGVSQQVYLQSTLMMQINETMQSFDIDVQTSTLGDILLQLQNSYQVQQSIQTILNGWSTPSGLAVRVEMN